MTKENIPSTTTSHCAANQNSTYHNNNEHVPLITVTISDIQQLIEIILIVVGGTFFFFWTERRRRKQRGDRHCSFVNRKDSNAENNNDENKRKIFNNNKKRKDNRNDNILAAAAERKKDFLVRAGDNYGYPNCPSGFIDGWRHKELPSLIRPVELLLDDNSDNGDEVIAVDDDDNDEESYYEREEEEEEEEEKEVYLDYAGSALPTLSQLGRIYNNCNSNNTATGSNVSVLGNPHSTGPAASRTLRAIEAAKKRILDHYNAGPGRYAPTRQCKEDNTDEDEEAESRYCYNHHHNYHPGYEIVFTSGTTQAMQIVAERFPLSSALGSPGDDGEDITTAPVLVYPQESHTSVVGMRGPFGGDFVCKPLGDLMRDIDENKMHTWKKKKKKTYSSSSCSDNSSSKTCDNNEDVPQSTARHHHLVVLPLECNFGGHRPTTNTIRSTIRKLQSASNNNYNTNTNNERFCTLLDIAKASATGPVDLKKLNPEFACLSFYKLFGEPTGLGVLFVRRDMLDTLLTTSRSEQSATGSSSSSSSSLRRPYFGGGSVDVVLPTIDFAVSRLADAASSSVPTSLVAGLSNGTVHFRGIVSLSAGFAELDRVGGMKSIHRHAVCLAKELVLRLRALVHHDNNNNNNNNSYRPAVELYGAWKDYCADEMSDNNNAVYDYDDDVTPGPTVAFNIRRADGSYVGYNEVSKLASLNHPPIQLRTGCFCNPGACQQALGLSNEDILRNYAESGHVCGDQIDILHGKPTGAIRASFGKDSTWEDLDALVAFIERLYISNGEVESCMVPNTSTRCWDDGGSPTQAILSELYLFPIKSCAAQRVRRWMIIEASGKLAFDREFALVDSSGIAMRLQTYPKMAFIKPTIDIETQTMKVSAPDRPDLVLSLADDVYSMERQALVNVCGNRCGGKLWGDHEVSVWFSDFLGVQCFLARYSTTRGYELPQDSRSPPSVPSSLRSPNVAFANEQPILLISEHAVEALNDLIRAGHEQTSLVATRHFRPNMVVKLAGRLQTPQKYYHIEDGWASVQIFGATRGNDGFQFDVVGPCARCSMVDVDPLSGMKGRTLRTLAGYRTRRGQINFGIFLRASSSSVIQCSHAAGDNNYNNLRHFWVEEGDVISCE